MNKPQILTPSGKPTAEQLQAINKLCRRDFKPDDLFVFSVVLCDNDIDRDFDRFSSEALQKLAKLYVGKTGIYDHSGSSRDQVARIFECCVEYLPDITTKTDEPYCRLLARAYMPKTASNADLVTQIDAGIKKEVSVGCAFDGARCSVCGKNPKTGECLHQKGRYYDGKLCFHTLDHPVDAYEWSFVAVPAQKRAGVVKKSFKTEKGDEPMDLEAIKKSLNSGKSVSLTTEAANALCQYIADLEADAKAGRAYFEKLSKDVVKLFNISDPEPGVEFYENVAKKLSLSELEAMKKSLKNKLNGSVPPTPRLSGEQNPEKDNGICNYII